MVMAVRLYTPTDKQPWDSYVLSHPDSTHCHLSGWKEVIENTYGHKTYYLIAERSCSTGNSIDPTNPLKVDPENPVQECFISNGCQSAQEALNDMPATDVIKYMNQPLKTGEWLQ